MLEKVMLSGKLRDCQARKPIPKAGLQNERTYKRQRSGQRDLQWRSALAFIEHLARAKRRVPLANHALMIRNIARGVVKKISRKYFDARIVIHDHRFVNQTFAPASAAAIKQAKLIVRIPAAAFDPSIHIKGAPGNAISLSVRRVVGSMKGGN